MGDDLSYIDQLMASEQGTTMDDIVRMSTNQKPKELSTLAQQLLSNWQGLGENVGIGSSGTERAEIGGRLLAQVAEDFAQRLQSQGITDISQAKFAPGAQAAWTPEGKGNVSLVATKDGRLIPVWGSSSDAGKARQVALALGSAFIAPGLAGALGGGLAGSAGTGALLGAGRAAITGGNILKGALTGGLTGGLGYGVSKVVDPFAADIGKSVGDVAGKTVGEAAKGAISGAARSAVGAGITGGNIGDALLSGAIGGGVNAAVGNTLSVLPKELRGPVTAAVSAGLLGKDPTQAAIMSYAGSLLKNVPNPFVKGFAGNVDLSASDAIEGFTDPGGEGYVDPTAGNLPSWALDPYGTSSDAYYGSDPSQEKYADEDRLLGKYPAPPQIDEPKTSMSPQEMSRFLEANIDDPVIVDGLMQEYFPDLYRQSINVTGTLPNQEPITAPRSIRDIGTVTTISPDEVLEGTTIEEPDLSVGLPSVSATKTGSTGSTGGSKAGGTGGTKSGGSKDTKDSGSGLDLGALFGIMGALANQQQPMRTASPNVARIDTESPFGLMYGLRG